MGFLFEPRPIADALALNGALLGQLMLITLLLIPLGFLVERMNARWRRVVKFALVAIVIAGVMVGTATAADGTPCVVCTLDGIFNLISCFFWWC